MQTTLAGSVRFGGIGLHGGRLASLVIRPAPAGHGIRFRRTDAAGGGAVIPALWTHVAPYPLCTRISDGAGHDVSTIEHLMAALAGCGVTNARIDIDGDEVPILDGSAAPFVDGLQGVGLRRLGAPLRAIRMRAPVEVRHGLAVARLDPADRAAMAFSIDFEDAAIGRQSLRLDLGGDRFAEVLSDSRTFCRLGDVERMRAEGLALGGNFHNAVVVDGARVLSPGGLRHPDEAVRHKMLDALGDLALAGAPILGLYTGVRAGHALTAALVSHLHATPDAWEWVEVDAALARRLPGGCVAAAAHRPAAARMRATA
ncbi:UDP-3-O-acyl-N-acetylglucosamine deacetylase [Rhodobaculum claviforme]|uniref:UDP-3-O-acyl-N-acetylglucosamine deacetylase n=1 Tax=Rhodobaculum claviforme TaxID=1549854 RepID=A0A934TN53_9RHOB|nr:UDP-3-O-[3-hydroxymyristoyl] N-acetylglucosamine deacetylase [Rhodobaculum claviforme]